MWCLLLRPSKWARVHTFICLVLCTRKGDRSESTKAHTTASLILSFAASIARSSIQRENVSLRYAFSIGGREGCLAIRLVPRMRGVSPGTLGCPPTCKIVWELNFTGQNNRRSEPTECESCDSLKLRLVKSGQKASPLVALIFVGGPEPVGGGNSTFPWQEADCPKDSMDFSKEVVLFGAR